MKKKKDGAKGEERHLGIRISTAKSLKKVLEFLHHIPTLGNYSATV